MARARNVECAVAWENVECTVAWENVGYAVAWENVGYAVVFFFGSIDCNVSFLGTGECGCCHGDILPCYPSYDTTCRVPVASWVSPTIPCLCSRSAVVCTFPVSVPGQLL